MRILAVDDDPVILQLLRGALTGEDMGCDLVCCDSAEEALETLERSIRPFDCFLLDVMLPGIDGIELCGMLRDMPDHKLTPIIMITASTDPNLMGRAFGAGATDFVTKPLNGLDLGARINTASMLNDSMMREREAKLVLAEMTAKMRLRFDEILVLETRGVTDVPTMENDLLRLPEGCYAMQLFSVEVNGLRDRHERISAPAFRQHIERVAGAMVTAMDGHSWKLAYAGSGRFVGITMGRRRLDPDMILSEARAALEASWDRSRCEIDTPPSLRMTALSDQRLWSGRSAGDHLHGALKDFFAAEEHDDLSVGFKLAAE